MKTLPETMNLSDAIALLNKEQVKPFHVCELIADKVADLMEHEAPQAGPMLHFITDTYLYTDCKAVRIAIENCFLYRLGNRIFSSPQHSRLLKMLPAILHDILMRQMLATGL